MTEIIALEGCTVTPFGSYLKALGVLRLVSEQADAEARGWWADDGFRLESRLTESQLKSFFLETYAPTPIVAPWNGGSGFYPKDNKTGLSAIYASKDQRFALYRQVIEQCEAIPEVRQGKAEAKDEDARRTAILLQCRNTLPDQTVEWLDAAVGISADGKRSFAPVLGTGGNEGRLDYTNNFMARVSSLLLGAEKKAPELLENALYGRPTDALQPGAAGQYDPGRAGGANQGAGIENDSPTNPWDLVLTLEGAVAWASGLSRRQGVSYRSFLCSPFTVAATKSGYGSASDQDDARAEIWTPIWTRRATYQEIRVLLREGRASVDGRAAQTGMQFAEAATGLGVDRSIDRFVRYNLLKRRGDSYVALPAGIFSTEYRQESDRIREIDGILSELERRGLPKGCEAARRRLQASMLQTLMLKGAGRLRSAVMALGALTKQIATATDDELPRPRLDGHAWLEACGKDSVELRIAAALASLNDWEAGPLRDNLTRASKCFAWRGRDLPDRLLSVLESRQRQYSYREASSGSFESQPFRAAVLVHAGDATRFIEGSTDDAQIEDLMYGFLFMTWDQNLELKVKAAEALPAYAALKHLYVPKRFDVNGQRKLLPADPRITAILRSGDVERAVALAVHRLRIAGLRPVKGRYPGGLDARRLGAALLIPAHDFAHAILQERLNQPATA